MTLQLRSDRGCFSLWLSAILAVASSACEDSCSVTPIARSARPRVVDPVVSSDDAEAQQIGNSAFAIDAYKEMAGELPGHNVFFSPHSISVDVAMLFAGARGQTADEIARAMHFALPPERLHPAFNALNLQLARSATQGVTLRVADSFWAQMGLPVEPSFLDVIGQHYDAGVRMLDFTGDPSGSRKRINGWVEAETEKRISEFLPKDAINRQTTFVLVNAVYWRGLWEKPFEVEATQSGVFVRNDGSGAFVPMMRDLDCEPGVLQTASCDVVEIPYKGGEFAMDIIMPKKGTFASFESAFDLATLDSLLTGVVKTRIQFSMPKFTIHAPIFDMKRMLRALGVRQAFDPSAADLTGIARLSPVRLFLAKAYHNAYLEIDEQGTVAAAASALIGEVTGGPRMAIHIDHPFLLLIRHLPTRAILFAGRVLDPTAASK